MARKKIGFPSDYRGDGPEPPPEEKPNEQDPKWTRADIALLRRAGRSRWNVPEEVRSGTV